MRLRNIPGAREIIENSNIVVKEFLPWRDIFKNNNPIHIEIGMGKGDFIITLAQNNPNINYIGIEMYSSVLIRAIEKASELNLQNLRFIRFDATNLRDIFEENSVEHIYLNFSDPWPKDRHARRRLTSDRFLNIYSLILIPDGVIEQKTDNVDLFNFSLESFRENSWEISAFSYDYHNEKFCVNNVLTEYEKKFADMGKPICYLKAHRKVSD